MPPGLLVPGNIPPALLFAVGGLGLVRIRNVVEQEPLAFTVAEHAALAANALGDQDASHARRPDHPGGMKLDKLHVDERGAGAIGQRVAVAGILPAITGHPEGLADASGGEHDGLGAEHLELALLTVIGGGARDAVSILEKIDDGGFHVDVDTHMDGVVLEGSDHLQACPVADVRQAGILVAAEVALHDAAVLGAVKHRAPGFEFAGAVGGFLGVQLGHAAIVEVLSATHGVGEVHAPVVAVIDIAQ